MQTLPTARAHQVIAIVALLCAGCQTSHASRQTITGYLEVAPFVYGKGSQPVSVHGKRGSFLLTMWFHKRYLRWVNKRVVATGGWADFNPHGQSFRYFKTTSIKLAPGEQPHHPLPLRVPAPPVVRSKKQIRALRGTWGVAFGNATFHYTGAKRRMLQIKKVTLALSDGFVIEKYLWRATASRTPKRAPATIVFLRRRGRKLSLSPMKFCRGHVAHCGMKL